MESMSKQVQKHLLNQVSQTTCGFKPATDQMFHFIVIAFDGQNSTKNTVSSEKSIIFSYAFLFNLNYRI